ncbi:hypothetical protein MOBT1_002272 [Malassezia obtusa]|uniref:Uncharacterized protein n=1 Tax=Malassezia obtusa TaxID=76774 RepID=A0AAF0E0U6_9BASI|nr:hypothetical protein MOBT1_002272 [Malassezia obtusa]
MSDMLARDADGEVPHAFASYPSPPSSGRGAVSLPSGDKRTRYTAEQSDANDDDHHTKRARSQSMRTAILTPPSTRGRRMGDRLGLGDGALAACPPSTSRHQRSDSDTVCCSWLPENARLGMDARPYARLYTAPQFDTYPVHDAAHNPFLEGGPADVGFTGPHAYRARLRATSLPRKELGKSLFVLYFAGGTPRRNAVSDDEDWSGRPSARPRGLFAEELEARARRAERPPQAAHAELPAQPAHAVSDPEALWLSTMEHAKANTQPHPPRLSHQNEKLLAQLERVDWSSDEEDTRDD